MTVDCFSVFAAVAHPCYNPAIKQVYVGVVMGVAL